MRAIALLFLSIFLSLVVAEGAVKLNEGNFDSIALNGGKNSFVKFFAPWCGHCKRMAPAWGELGTKYEGNEKVVIGDVDCTVERFGVKGYPTIKYFTKETGASGEQYKGGRETAALEDFVKKTLE